MHPFQLGSVGLSSPWWPMRALKLEQIITDLVVIMGGSFQMIYELVVGYDLLQFAIAYNKHIKLRFWTLSPSACSMSSTTFLVTFALSLSPFSPGGNKKVLPTRSSGLNPGKGLLEVGPSSCLDLI